VVRLCEKTRKFAYESIHGRYGTEALKTPYVSLDDIKNFDTMNDLEKYDTAIRKIVTDCPIRIAEDELISGSANLGNAIYHLVPAYWDKKPVFSSISHVTLGFDKALRMGINAMEKELDSFFRLPGDNLFRDSLKNTITSFRIWHSRYLNASRKEICINLSSVPLNPPNSFYEAVQSLWFLFAFTRLCGNWPGIGRIDQMLGQYLKKDLQNGSITLDEAREILAHFFIKGCEWIQTDTPTGTGDAQHYQNIVLSGIDEYGNDVTNEVTFLVLDIVEELGISDFPISIRVTSHTDEKLLRRAAEVVRLGGGIIAFYNEDLIIKSLTDYKYSLQDARKFANDGCWEVQVPGETFFTYCPFDSLRILLDETLKIGKLQRVEFCTYDELFEAYIRDLGQNVRAIIENWEKEKLQKNEDGELIWRQQMPDSVISMFIEGCAKRGKPYCMGGPNYNVVSPHIGGAADTANSLYAIKKIVYEEKKVTLNELCKILEMNWEGYEPFRLYVRDHYSYYGNDCDESDAVMAELLNRFAGIVLSTHQNGPFYLNSGCFDFGMAVEWVPCGRQFLSAIQHGDILSETLLLRLERIYPAQPAL
jgi:formate C-acetyltransferase